MQAPFKFKIKIEALDEENQKKIMELPSAPPDLDMNNAAGRLVYVPPEAYPNLNPHGWVAKILKVDKRGSEKVPT